MNTRIPFVALASAFFSFPALAADWPQFRGPLGNGVSTEKGLPIQWSETKNIAWKQEIPGKGWSSPALVKGRLYLTTAVLADDKLSQRALCINAKDGKPVWDVEIFARDSASVPGIHGKNSHASPTPLVDGGKLYVHFGHQGTACLDLDGNILWKTQELVFPPVHGNGNSPVLVDGLLVFSCDGASNPFVAALDAATGNVQWKFARESDSGKKFAFATCIAITVGGKKQVISPGAGVVNALDPKTGKEIWRVTYDGYSVIPRPVFGHGLVYMSTGYDSPSILAIRPDGQGDVTDSHVEWTLKKGAPHTPSPLLVGNELYLVSDGGIATCVDAKTGEVHWSERIGTKYSASPVFADGRVYCQDEDGKGIVLKAGRTFQKLGENGFGEPSLASYCVGDGAFFVRTEKHLYRVATSK
ncbi:MAG: PQQ-binding-like beta-propeller repeat protein [Pirellulaceae bacterium]|nr:PQQ-binding-like beta-propeller repeat protein [Pirellulaceae bacterium]